VYDVTSDGLSPVKLVGTVHVSSQSRERVIETIRRVDPAHVAIELDPDRFERLWYGETLGVGGLLRSELGVRAAALLLLLNYRQRRMADSLGIEPGTADMLPAAETAHEIGATLSLIDADAVERFNRLAPRILSLEALTDTVRRFGDADERDSLRAVAKDLDDIVPDTLVRGSQQEVVDYLESMDESEMVRLFELLDVLFPTASSLLMHERNEWMAGRLHHLRTSGDGPIVAVLGRGHVPAVRRLLDAPETIPHRCVGSSPTVRFLDD
jgi:pheromone shutdown protein TraB